MAQEHAAEEPVGLSFGSRIAPLRFVAFILLLPLGFAAHQCWVPGARWTDSAPMAFDLAAMVFLVSLIPLLRGGDAETIRRHADANDANRVLILLVTSLLTIIVMVTIAGELPGAKHGNPWAIVRLVGTLLLIWLFANTVYALHYAHEYYHSQPDCTGDRGGLEFPGQGDPGYADFAYFSFTLGMTFQTSDVDISARRIRAVALIHCFAAFVFNLGIIAFTVNALGGGGS
jgi:uncharacterized membrane protein